MSCGAGTTHERTEKEAKRTRRPVKNNDWRRSARRGRCWDSARFRCALTNREALGHTEGGATQVSWGGWGNSKCDLWPRCGFPKRFMTTVGILNAMCKLGGGGIRNAIHLPGQGQPQTCTSRARLFFCHLEYSRSAYSLQWRSERSTEEPYGAPFFWVQKNTPFAMEDIGANS